MNILLNRVILLIFSFFMVVTIKSNYLSEFEEGKTYLTDKIKYLDYGEELYEMPEDDYYISILLNLDYDLSSIMFDYSNIPTDIATDEASFIITEQRERVKNYVNFHNNRIINNAGLNEYDYSISWCAPYAEIIFDNIMEYEDNIDELSTIINECDEIISSSAMCYSFLDSNGIDNINFNSPYQLSTAFDDIGLTNRQYTGANIKVGMLESGIPDDTSIFNYINTDGNYSTLHCTITSSIVGSTFGIAPDVILYCKSRGNTSLTDMLNYFVYTCNVDIVNMSHGVPNNPITTYDDLCAYYDKISILCAITIVKSSGNEGENGLSSPGLAMNVITVGSTNNLKQVASSSSYLQTCNQFYKPEVVAPAECLDVNYFELEPSDISGTSFATPMVTGIVALLMEEFPFLKCCPQSVKAAICSGCELLPLQTSFFEIKKGFGLVNYANSRLCLSSNFYSAFYIPINMSYDDCISIIDVTLPSNNRIEISANWDNISSYIDSTNYSYQYSTLYFKLFDYDNNRFVGETNSTNSNLSYFIYANPTSNTKNYKIYVYSLTNKSNGVIENGFIVYSKNSQTHVHDYDYSYVPYSNTNHKCVCGCGEYIYQPHVIDLNSPGRFAVCNKCGALVDKNNFPFS